MTADTTLSAGFKSVLAIWDSDAHTAMLMATADLAARHGAALTVLSCIERPADLAILSRLAKATEDEIVSQLVADRRAALQTAVGAISNVDDVRAVVTVGKPFVEIIRHVIHNDTDLVVKTAEAFQSGRSIFTASTDQHLVRKCPCPVWVRGAGDTRGAQTILATVDVDIADAAEPETLTRLNEAVLTAALNMATGMNSKIYVLHAWEALAEGLVFAFSSAEDSREAAAIYVGEVEANRHRALDALVLPYATGNAFPVIPKLVRGAIREVIPAQCAALQADVVVMGTVARTHLSGIIIGNTAEDMLNGTKTPVLAVKPPGFVSPLDKSLR
ncbi:MAG: universal stress protein [Pseudomonadota bacterium]